MFKIDFDIPKATKCMQLKEAVFLMGSCFSHEIGSKLTHSKFSSISNPFGTIYNPYSIFKLLQNKLDNQDLIKSQGVYFHWDAAGSISDISKNKTSELFNQKRKDSQEFLKKTKWLIITLGTSIIYELADGRIVGNCHKIPAKKFKKRFLQQEEILHQFYGLYEYLDRINPNIQIVFTVSPIRHIKEGLIANNRSKSILLDAVHRLEEAFECVSYFPSYEILIDELRDYRFYATDMIHPSVQAVNYVWEKFTETYFDLYTLNFIKEWEKITSDINHRPLQPQSESHQFFLKNTLEKLKLINEKVDVSIELGQIKEQIL